MAIEKLNQLEICMHTTVNTLNNNEDNNCTCDPKVYARFWSIMKILKEFTYNQII